MSLRKEFQNVVIFAHSNYLNFVIWTHCENIRKTYLSLYSQYHFEHIKPCTTNITIIALIS